METGGFKEVRLGTGEGFRIEARRTGQAGRWAVSTACILRLGSASMPVGEVRAPSVAVGWSHAVELQGCAASVELTGARELGAKG